MVDQKLMDKLVAHRTVGSAPREELEWLAEHGEMHYIDAGTFLAADEITTKFMHVLFKGRISFHQDAASGRHRIIEWRAGDVTGILPYSRMTRPPGSGIVEEPAEALFISASLFPEMIVRCPNLTASLVHVMLDRARVFARHDVNLEKLISLGKLSAGLAHELNNPASAAARTAKLLVDDLSTSEESSRALGATSLTAEQAAAVDAVREMCIAADTGGVRSPLELADREEAISDWLDDHGADSAAAAALADTPVTFEALNKLASSLSGEPLNAALRWIASGCSVRKLAMEIERSASRIYELVGSVKRLTYMDRELALVPISVEQGLRDTVRVMATKAREKKVAISLDIAEGLPQVQGYGGELAQVWTNLLDNALDAVDEEGRIAVTAGLEAGYVIVRVSDNGPGIPEDRKAKIFDPFFTTKPPGKGTGLGLDIARRIVFKHRGEIDFESRPGHTVFRVALPLLGSAPMPVKSNTPNVSVAEPA